MPTIKGSDLQVNQPVESAAPDASLTVANNPVSPLKPGAHTFQLEVVDDSGNRSRPAQVRVVIVDNQAPTAIVTAPVTVPFGQDFTLSGASSVDAGGGKIVRYIWTLIQ